MTQEPDGLIAAISAAIAAHDPLDPWLVQSNYDDHYWTRRPRRPHRLSPRRRAKATCTRSSERFSALSSGHLTKTSTSEPVLKRPPERCAAGCERNLVDNPEGARLGSPLRGSCGRLGPWTTRDAERAEAGSV